MRKSMILEKTCKNKKLPPSAAKFDSITFSCRSKWKFDSIKKIGRCARDFDSIKMKIPPARGGSLVAALVIVVTEPWLRVATSWSVVNANVLLLLRMGVAEIIVVDANDI